MDATRWYVRITYFLFFSGLLGSCASDRASRGPQSEAPNIHVELTSAEQALKTAASTFDQFVRGDMSAEDLKPIKALCQMAPEKNAFCYGYLNYEKYDEKRRVTLDKDRQPKAPKEIVKPRFRGKAITNWDAFRASSVNSLLRVTATLSPSEAASLKEITLAESRCPNNPAIAIASNEEDLLPEDAKFEEIGNLYEKGADCLVKNLNDRQTLLTRAGIFHFVAKNWKTAARVLTKASSFENVFIGRSLYWLARTHQEMGNPVAASAAIDQLQAKYPFAFHTLMALTGSGKDPGLILLKPPSALARRSTQMPAMNSLIGQVETLWRFQFEATASKVLDWAVAESNGVEPEVMVYLAELKREQGDYVSKITILSDVLYKNPSLISRETMELYFPKVYFPVFERRAGALDPYLLLSVARRESAFNPKAKSPANARGLLQVLPGTAGRVKVKSDLFDPENNVEAGSRYLTELLKKLEGRIHLALAAYNAGPGRVAVWTNRYPMSEPVLFVDLIPYRETREYVASVLRNYYWYRRIHRGETTLDPKQILELAISQ